MAEKVKKIGQFKPTKKPGKAKIVKPQAPESLENRADVADKLELLQFWTTVLRQKDCSDKDRLRASEYLGKYHQVFVEKSIIDLNASGELAAAIVRELSRKNNGNSK